ncbi:cupin domain-containing protein [Fundicoccus sp. Sow4_H7]|uniref:cupin domain-containing protein n=1 Tax=Fundicoccus sp. Sow4_H7 TaxID=3438784 RepID=UPI003F90B7FF
MSENVEHKDHGKEPYVVNIDKLAVENNNYRTTLWTGEKLQVTTMTIQPGDDIGLEIHEGIDQFLHIVSGQGICKMGPTEDNLDFTQEVYADDAIFVPADVWHNVENNSGEPLKLYTVYAGPDHLAGTVHETHQDAIDDPNEH